MVQGYFIDDRKVGQWQYFGPNAQLLRQQAFARDVPHGEWFSRGKGKRWTIRFEQGEVRSIRVFGADGTRIPDAKLASHGQCEAFVEHAERVLKWSGDERDPPYVSCRVSTKKRVRCLARASSPQEAAECPAE